MANEEDQEKKYEVKDKRRVNPDGTIKEQPEEEPKQTPPEEQAEVAQEETREEAPKEQAAEEKAERAAGEEPLPPPNVYGMLEFVAGLLAEQAWQLMGLRLAPGQKEMIKDMAQAKIAIDTVVFISDKLHPHISEEDRKALRTLISDLQMNFVMQSK